MAKSETSRPDDRCDPEAVTGPDSSWRSDATSTAVDPERATEPIDRDGWLRLHATDLIDRLTDWSDDLDARQAQLNATIAKHERRERQFRLQRQIASVELREQQRSVQRLRERIEAHARRLAFRDA
jgi:hypothetical protein